MAESSKEKLLQTLARISAAQLCQQATFNSASSQALDVLADVLCQLTREVARRAKSNAENCNRTECNLQDTLSAVEILGANSRLLKEHMNAHRANGFPFVMDQVPMYRKSAWRPKREPRKVEEDDQIPSFFPANPPAHTFLYTPVEVGRPKENGNEKAELALEKRALEDRLATLLTQKSDGEMDAEMRDGTANPFLQTAAPSTEAFLDQI